MPSTPSPTEHGDTALPDSDSAPGFEFTEAPADDNNILQMLDASLNREQVDNADDASEQVDANGAAEREFLHLSSGTNAEADRYRFELSEYISDFLAPDQGGGRSRLTDSRVDTLAEDTLAEIVARHAEHPQARDDDSEADADEEWLIARRNIRHLRHEGISTDEDEIKYLRAEAAHNARIARAKRHIKEKEHEAAQSTTEGPDLDPDAMFVDDPESDARACKPKSSRKIANTHARRSSHTPVGTQAKVSKRQQKAQRIREHQENNLANLSRPLVGSSVWRDIHENHAREDEPGFQATTRRNALRELISAIPDEDRATARIDKQQMEAQLKLFTPNGSCKSDGKGAWRVHNVESSLSHYQMLGVAWMRDREVRGASAGYGIAGGLIADAMGLGKTVMMIANIVNDAARKTSDDRCTLIVLPSALISQWRSEIHKHARILAVGEQHSRTAVVDKSPGAGTEMEANRIFNKFDVILTTYAQVCREYPRYEPPADCTTAEQKNLWWEERCRTYIGPLLKHRWRRVVLDEAQAIKNHKSQTSIAVRAISGIFHWAITGTPAQNSIQEFYPYFKFLKVPTTGSFRTFKQNMCTDDETGQNRLAQLLRTFMLRRSHADQLLGAKLLILPKAEHQTVNLAFTELERVIYQTVHRCFVHRINGFMRAGTLHEHHNHVLCMLLRLRQLVGHPLLIMDSLRDILDDKDYNEIRKAIDMTVPSYSSEAAILTHLRQMLEVHKPDLTVMDGFGRGNGLAIKMNAVSGESVANAIAIEEDASHPFPQHDDGNLDAMISTEPRASTSVTGASFGMRNDFGDFFTHLQTSRIAPSCETCGFCGTPPDNPVRGSCGHLLCNGCTMQLVHQVKRDKAQGTGDGKMKCPMCSANWQQSKLYEMNSTARNPYKANPPVEKGKKPSPQKIVETWVDDKGKMLPSTKTSAVKAALLNFQLSEPGAKCIIYTSFITMVHILAQMCQIEGFGCELLHGGMEMPQRDKAIRNFESDPNKTVLIATLKCGGVGLNLTMASKVILVDLWWNSSVEEQAFCRTYRRGQEKPTTFYRLLINGTVDDHLAAMQARKEEEILAVMGGSSKQFTTSELVKLFGVDDVGSTTKPFIIVPGKVKHRDRPHQHLDDDDEARYNEDDE